jgi:hypothetical protein
MLVYIKAELVVHVCNINISGVSATSGLPSFWYYTSGDWGSLSPQEWDERCGDHGETYKGMYYQTETQAPD